MGHLGAPGERLDPEPFQFTFQCFILDDSDIRKATEAQYIDTLTSVNTKYCACTCIDRSGDTHQ
jgi:hypothetical protein